MITESDNTETSEALKRLLLFSGLIFFCTVIILINKTKVSTNDALTLFPVISLMSIVFVACVIFICRQGIKAQQQAEMDDDPPGSHRHRRTTPTVYVCRPGSRLVVSSDGTNENGQQTIQYLSALPGYQTVLRSSPEATTWHVALSSTDNALKPPAYSILPPQPLAADVLNHSTSHGLGLSPPVASSSSTPNQHAPPVAPPAYDEIETTAPTTSHTISR